MLLPICNYGKKMNNSPNKMAGQLSMNSFYKNSTRIPGIDIIYIYKYVSSGEESPFIIPHYYPLQIFRHTIKAVLSLAIKAH